jgi:hypothetical protein
MRRYVSLTKYHMASRLSEVGMDVNQIRSKLRENKYFRDPEVWSLDAGRR